MPSVKDMGIFARENTPTVLRWQEAIAHESVYPRIRGEVEATPRVLVTSRRVARSNTIYTYAVLCAMGYGAQWARDIIMVQLAIDRLGA